MRSHILDTVGNSSLFSKAKQDFIPVKSATTDPITDKGFMIVFLPLLQVIGRISIKFVTVLFAKVYGLFGSIHRSLPLFPVISLVNQKSAVGVFESRNKTHYSH